MAGGVRRRPRLPKPVPVGPPPEPPVLAEPSPHFEADDSHFETEETSGLDLPHEDDR